MKLVLQTQLLPDVPTASRLRETVERFNEACNWLAGVAFEHQCSRAFDLHKIAYRDLREKFGLPADMAVRCLAQVCDAFKRDKGIKPKFRKHAAVPYSMGKNIGFKGIDRVSIGTLEGRVIVPFIMGKYQADRFSLKKGQSDLVLRKDGKWFLVVTVDVPEGTPIAVTDFIGVDLGLASIATDSDGRQHSGKPVEAIRRKHNLQRKRLGKRNTKGAKKKLKRIAGNEARFRKHTNHVISKSIVEAAERTGRGIALEDLTGIRQRATAWGRDAKNRLSGWGFAELGSFVAYKARLAGIPVVFVDPRNTSRMCAVCGHVDKANRKSQAKFSCVSCGHAANADVNAAENISAQAVRKSALGLARVTPQPESRLL
jgi:putative transposase